MPALVELLGQHGVRASFFFSVGPDNMGRHLWRLRKPAFLWKMLRTRPARLYGWDILLRGTLWPGPVIGTTLAGCIRAAADAGHEVGLHAWDHHAWQSRADALRCRVHPLASSSAASSCSARSSAALRPARRRRAGAATSRCSLEKERFPFRYNSDCRGTQPFRPVVGGRSLSQPQIPVSLPTYDEVIGRDGVDETNYNDWLLGQLREDRLNVLGIHAEVEGIVSSRDVPSVLANARRRGIELVPLGALLADHSALAGGSIRQGHVEGREGPVACLA